MVKVFAISHSKNSDVDLTQTSSWPIYMPHVNAHQRAHSRGAPDTQNDLTTLCPGPPQGLYSGPVYEWYSHGGRDGATRTPFNKPDPDSASTPSSCRAQCDHLASWFIQTQIYILGFGLSSLPAEPWQASLSSCSQCLIYHNGISRNNTWDQEHP